MTYSPDRPPPPFAAELIERALRDEPEGGIDPSIARLIAATLASDTRPAISAFAQTGEIQTPTLGDELTAITRTFRPAWLTALRRFVASKPGGRTAFNPPERR